jgi:hypothetical protein
MLGEVFIPLAPTIPAIAIGLLGACVMVICLGTHAVWVWTFGHLFLWLARKRIHIPHVTTIHPLGFLESVSNDVANFLLRRAREGEALMGYMFHAVATITEWTVRETADLARETLHWATWLQRSHLPKWVKALVYATFPPALLARLVKAATTAHLPHLERIVRVKWRGLTRGQVAAMIAAAAGTFVTHLPGKTIYQRIREQAKPDGFTKKRLRRLEKLLAASGAVALTSVALRRMDLQWLRCRSLSKLAKRIGCGGFGVMEMLLGGTMEAFVLSDLCRFTNLLTATTEQLRPALLHLVDVEQALIACPGNSAPAVLHMPPLDIPPLVQESALAA